MEDQEKNRLITFIKENDKFYRFADFEGHTAEQLLKLKAKIQFEQFHGKNKKIKIPNRKRKTNK